MKTVVKVLPTRWAKFIDSETDEDGGLDKGEMAFIRSLTHSFCPEGHYLDRVLIMDWTPGSSRFVFNYKPF